MRTRGLTLVQTLVVLGILALLSSLTYPLIRAQVEKSKQRGCISNLKQIHAALMLYRETQGSTVPYGDASAMGLPTSLTDLEVAGYIELSNVRCTAPLGNYARGTWTSMFPVHGMDGTPPPWRDYVEQYKEDAILVADFNHDRAQHASSDFETHFAIGLYLGGHVRTIQRVGDATERTWWNP
jgi:Tfp pilus assembly protein PilE